MRIHAMYVAIPGHLVSTGTLCRCIHPTGAVILGLSLLSHTLDSGGHRRHPSHAGPLVRAASSCSDCTGILLVGVGARRRMSIGRNYILPLGIDVQTDSKEETAQHMEAT